MTASAEKGKGMTTTTTTTTDDLEARRRIAEERLLEMETELVDAKLELAREKRTRRKAVNRCAKARADSMFLHGVLLMHGIEVPERA